MTTHCIQAASDSKKRPIFGLKIPITIFLRVQLFKIRKKREKTRTVMKTLSAEYLN